MILVKISSHHVTITLSHHNNDNNTHGGDKHNISDNHNNLNINNGGS